MKVPLFRPATAALCVIALSSVQSVAFDFLEIFQSTGIDIKSNFGNNPVENVLFKNSVSCSPNDKIIEEKLRNEISNIFAEKNVLSAVDLLSSSGEDCRKLHSKIYVCKIQRFRLRRISGDSSATPNIITYQYKIEMRQGKTGTEIIKFDYQCAT